MRTRNRSVVAGEEAGERLDRVLAAHVAELSRSRLKALIEAGAVAVDGRTIRDPSHRVNSGAAIALDVPPPEPAKPAPEPIPLNVVYEDDDIIVIDKPEEPCRASRRRQLDRHAGQRADRPLRRQPLRHRRRAAARHRAPARQGHDRPHGGGEERPRAPRARRPIRRPWPQRRAVRARLSRLRLGRARTGRTAPSTSRSTATRARATAWRCARAGARPSPIGRCWNATAGGQASRGRRQSTAATRAGGQPARSAGSKPAGPTRFGSIWPRSAIRCWATRSMGRVFAPRARFCRRKPKPRWRPLADRPCMPISCGQAPIERRNPSVPVGTAARSCPFA